MKKNIFHTSIFIVALLSNIPLYAKNLLPKEARVPGGVAIIKLQNKSSDIPEVRYLGKRTCVIPDDNDTNTWLAIVGIPLDANLGSNEIEIITRNDHNLQKFTVEHKEYPTRNLTIPDKNKVTPPKTESDRIAREYLETVQTYDTWEYREIRALQLPKPAVGPLSSPFGQKRTLNKVAKSPHTGLDIAANLDTPVKAPIAGKVINVGDFFYTGNVVFVDHGQGFITSYCHLNSIAVKKDQNVKAGDVLGKVGKTGRVTGVHLHWSVSLNGVRVDPKLFLPE